MQTNGAFGILDSIEVPMRDGTILRADIWLPQGEGPWPVILQRTPYLKEDAFGTQYISGLDFRAALKRGYAIVIQDTRGRYSSDGAFAPFVHEADDGADTIGWLREQAFCNGKVVMFGASYVGATQVLAASANPEGLLAISPHLTTARHGDTWTYRSGAVELAFLMLWITESLGQSDLDHRLAAIPALDIERARKALLSLQRDPQAAFSRLPILDEDLLAVAPYAARWFDGDRAAFAAADREHLDALAGTRLPVLVSCGWNDLFVEGSIELFQTMRSRWGRAEAVRDRLIIGPWSHGNPTDWQGDFWLGYAAATVGLSDEQLDFFDAAIAGTTPQTPIVRYFRSGSNTWHAAPDWPLPGSIRREVFLTKAELSDHPGAAWSRSFTSDTLSPVPTTGGATFVPGLLQGRNSGPKDQALVEQRDDVLVFTSTTLGEDLEVTGLVEATVWVSSTGQSADWTARLCEVDGRGRSIGLLDGIHRETQTSAVPHAVTIRLGHVSHLFRKGNQIRLQLASSNFPRFDRNPQSGKPATLAMREDFKPTTHSIYGGLKMPSCLTLAVIVYPFPNLKTFHLS